ncbi:MAG: hypothetical protein VYC62_05560, partial [Verrucomicrobiota bacterium]|nr:hypothetical protein [Verrucomicrobiota bacterium]
SASFSANHYRKKSGNEKKQLHPKNVNQLKYAMNSFGRFVVGTNWIDRPHVKHGSGMQYQPKEHSNSPKAIHVM